MRNNERATTWQQSPPASTSGSGSPRNRSPRAPPERHPTSSPCSPSSNAAPAQSPTSPSKTLGPPQARARRISRIAAKTRRIFLRGKFRAPTTTTTGARWSGPWAPPGSSSRWASCSWPYASFSCAQCPAGRSYPTRGRTRSSSRLRRHCPEGPARYQPHHSTPAP